ncbi:MAG: Uma2 family endonuclease [Prochlorothrix sp.]|nr:Uma2 family endonuclease [Prochlorothrix sp.]
MIGTLGPQPLSPQAYLQQEQASPIKHEYRNGFAYAMAGTTDRHNTIVGNLYSLLRQHLRGTPCSVYFADGPKTKKRRVHFTFANGRTKVRATSLGRTKVRATSLLSQVRGWLAPK